MSVATVAARLRGDGMSTPKSLEAGTDTTTRPLAIDPKSFKTFAEFYPFYLAEHSNLMCRRLHFVGSTLSLACLGTLIATGNTYWLGAAVLCGYGFAWIGHFGFEKNRPASFRRPLYSFRGDWAMYRDIWTGRVKI
jgi:hypothetical protein